MTTKSSITLQLDDALQLRKKQQFAAATTVYHDILSQQPQHVGALLGLSQVLRQQGEFTQALTLLKNLQRQQPNNVQVIFQQALVYRQQGNHVQAAQCFQDILSIKSDHTASLVNLATELFILGDVKQAMQIMQQVLHAEPNNLAALLQVGDWLKAARENEAAIVYFQKAVIAHPAQMQPYLHLADALLNVGKITESLDVLELASQRIGKQASIYCKRATIFWFTRQFDTALATINAGLALFADDFAAQLQRIHYQIALGYFKHSEQLIAQLPVNNFNQHIQATLVQAKLAEAQWHITKAITLYKAILHKQAYCIVAHKALRRLLLIMLNVPASKYSATVIAQYNIGLLKISGQQLDEEDGKYVQDHHTQIMQEYAAHSQTVHRLQQTTKLAAKQRLQQLATLVEAEPDVTATAISFLLALRQQHYFSLSTATGKHAIPTTIFQYWDAAQPPAEVVAFAKTWQQHNPTYNYQRFNDDTARTFLQQYYPPEVVQSYQQSSHAAQKSDILRLALLYEFGGIYVDADDICLKPLATLLPDAATLVLYQDIFVMMGNNFIAAKAKHPVLGLALHNAVAAVLNGADSIWLTTGPGVLSRALAVYLAQHIKQQTPVELGVFILTKAQLLRAVGMSGKLAYKSTNDSWVVDEFKNAERFNFSELLG